MSNVFSDSLSWSLEVLSLGTLCPSFQDENRELGVSLVGSLCAGAWCAHL